MTDAEKIREIERLIANFYRRAHRPRHVLHDIEKVLKEKD